MKTVSTRTILDSWLQSPFKLPDESTCELSLCYELLSVLIHIENRTNYHNKHFAPGARFSKVPKTFRARKAISKTATRLFCKASLLICRKGIQ